MSRTSNRIRNARLELACHQLSGGTGRPLLLLHAMYGSSADWPDDLHWPGPVHAIDFCGHGESDWSKGGGYTLELFATDADAAVAHVEDENEGVAVAGVGMGAYVALLLAGGRPSVVRATLLAPGEGLGETDGEPDFDLVPERVLPPDAAPLPAGCDPALQAFHNEMKPTDYVTAFAERASRLLLLEDGGERPAWWGIAASQPGATTTGPRWQEALAALAQAP